MMEEDPSNSELSEAGDAEEGSAEMSYETMLQLGERIGDVKTERWKMVAASVIAKLPTGKFSAAALSSKTALGTNNDSEMKCLVCQCEYEEGEDVRTVPCGHVFHRDCVDEWLGRKDVCPYCSTCIRKE